MKRNFEHVLYIAPAYIDQKGGMASVMEVYSRSIEHFHFLPTYKGKGAVYNCVYFVVATFTFLKKLLTSPDIKIIHFHSASRGSFFRKSILLLIAKFFRKKTVLHIHGGEFRIFYTNLGKFRFLVRYVLKKMDVLVCLSIEWKEYFDSIVGYPKAIVINNPVEMAQNTGSIQPTFPLQVLFLNRIYKAKGIYDVLEVFKDNKEVFKGRLQFIIAGDGENELINKFINENDLAGLVDFKGWVAGEEKNTLIRNCHVFILTSYNEGLPMSILEAMSFGKAIIATKVGGIPQIVKPQENGWLLDAGDNVALADILRNIVANPLITVAYGCKSLALVEDYSSVKVVEKLGNVYAGLMTNK